MVTAPRESPIRLAWYVHPLRLGGQERFLLRLARCLDPRKVRVSAIFASKGEVVEHFAANGVETRVLAFRSFRLGFEELARTLSSHSIDLVQTNMFTPLAAIAAGQVGIPHIWRVGGHPDVALRRMSPDDRRNQLQLAALQSAAVVCNSQFVAHSFAALPVSSPVVIRNGIPLPPVLEEPAAKNRLSKALRICMLAHFDPQKRHEDLIRAAAEIHAQLPRARFFLFGSTFAEPSMVAYKKHLRGLVKSLGLQGVVIMRRTHDARAELFRATASVMPSIDESSSNAILESMACGTPVVAADSGGNSEMIETGFNGLLVTPRSPERLAQALLEIVRNPSRALQLADRARERIRSDYDIDACARRYEKLYQSCVPNPGLERPRDATCAA